MSRLMIMAGGTGGHVMPALAVARKLKERGVDIRWIGNPEGLEATIVPAAGFDIDTIHIKGLRKSGLIRKLAMPFILLRAGFEVFKVLRKWRPDALLGMGGFVSGPGGLVGRLMGSPLVLHEQNAVAGLTNRLLAPFAKRVLSGFPETDGLQAANWVGNPVRPEISSIEHPESRLNDRNDSLRVLIIGGSQGAQVFNERLPELLGKTNQPELEIWHQCGKNRVEPVRAAYESVNLKARTDEFIDDMAAAYAWADIVICRAGAMTVAEICAAGAAAIFVPYPYAVGDHQTQNADYLVSRGAAWRFSQTEFEQGLWLNRLTGFKDERGSIREMACAAKSLSRPDAAEEVAKVCEELMHA